MSVRVGGVSGGMRTLSAFKIFWTREYGSKDLPGSRATGSEAPALALFGFGWSVDACASCSSCCVGSGST